MADQGLKIVIGAEVNQAVQGIKQLDASLGQLGNSGDLKRVEQELDRLQKAGVLTFGAIGQAINTFKSQLKTATNPAEINKLTTAISALENKTKQLANVNIKASGFDDVAQKSKSATQALGNLGRVAQDLPFGFIGIANNLNPLLESFQRLRAETGSGKAALSALGSSLTGAGGLGLALSVVTAAASFASIGMQAWGGSLFGASKEAEALKKKAEELKSAIDGAFSSTAQEATRVTALTAILQNETETRKRRLAAIKELQDIQPEIFAGLKLEGDAVTGLDGAYKKYLERLNTVVAAKIKQAQLEAKITELLHLQGKTLVGNEKLLIEGTAKLAKVNIGVGKLFEENQKRTNAAIKNIQSDIDGLTKDLIELSPGIDVKFPDEKVKKVKEAVNIFISRALGDLNKREDLIPLTILPLPLELQPLADASKLALKFSSVKEEIDRKLKQFALRESVVPLTLIKQIELDPNLKIDPSTQDKIRREIQASFASNIPLKIEFTASGEVKFEIDKKKLEEDAQKQINDALQGIQIGAFSSIGDAIGDALSGKGIQDAFKGFGNILAAGMRSIGQALIQFGIQSKAIQLALKSLNPYVAIAAGIALIALSKGLQNSLSGAREKGGPVSRGLNYLVNEKGKEIFVPNNTNSSPAWIEGGMRTFTPPSSGRIIPANQAPAFAAKFQNAKPLNFFSNVKSAATAKVLAANFNIRGFDSGGLVSGPTFGLLGEGAGISSLNPEVVAPLQSLKSLLNTGAPSINVNITGRLRNREIRLGQSREGRSQGRTANG